MKRRTFLGGVCGAAFVPMARTALGGDRELHVFLDTMLDSRALHNLLSEALAGVSVRVFGRSREFERSVRTAPRAVLARSPVLEALNLAPALRGTRGGSDLEPFVLLSEVAVTPASVSTVGAVDLFGRREMPAFVKRVLGGGSPEVVPVTKLVDLLPLLQFKKAQAVLLAKIDAEELKTRTRMKLVETALPTPGVGLPAVSFLKEESGLKQAFRSLESRVSLQFGVEKWR